MDFDFWNNCWARPTQPFHLTQPHHFLQKYFFDYFADKSKVLLPLCGKTQDLNFLAKHDIKAVGVEFNPLAVDSFFKESQLEPEVTTLGEVACYQTDNIELWLADFFSLTPEQLGQFELIFDRAALVALPNGLRAQYACHLSSFLAEEGILLLVTMEYNAAEMSGPPFLVDEEEVKQLFKDASIEVLSRQSILDSHPRWQELELTRLDEVLYKIHY